VEKVAFLMARASYHPFRKTGLLESTVKTGSSDTFVTGFGKMEKALNA
jgi:hypothetical protein